MKPSELYKLWAPEDSIWSNWAKPVLFAENIFGDEEPQQTTKWLTANIAWAPAIDSRTAVLHGDYRLENVVFDLAAIGRVNAVLDWEAATIGDPLVDLGLLLTFWEGPDQPLNPIASAHTRTRGFPSKRQLADRYATRTGFDLSRLGWYIALNHYRVAGMLEVLHYRVKHGLPVPPGLEKAGSWVAPLVENGLAALRDNL